MFALYVTSLVIGGGLLLFSLLFGGDAGEAGGLAEGGLEGSEVGEGAAVSDDEGTYAAWFAELDADVAVVRPDFYLYDACTAGRLDDVLHGLRSALRADVPVS